MSDSDYSGNEREARRTQRQVTPPQRERPRRAVNHTPQSSAPSSPQARPVREVQTRTTRSSRRLSNSITTNIQDSPSAYTRQQQLRQEQEQAFQEERQEEEQQQVQHEEEDTIWEAVQDTPPRRPVVSPRPSVRKRRLRSSTAAKSKIANTPSRTSARRRNFTPDTGTPTHEREDYGHGNRRTSTDTERWDGPEDYQDRRDRSRDRSRDRHYRQSKRYDEDERADSRPRRRDQREETPVEKVVHEIQDVAQNIIPAVNDVLGNATGMSGYIITTTKEVLGNLLRIFKTPLTYVVVIYVFFILGSFLLNKATVAVYKGLQPLCKPPMSSWIEMPFCETVMNQNNPNNGGGIDPEKLMNVQSKLGLVVADFGEGVSMARGMKGTEHAVRDLIAVVRNSDMPKKEEVGGLLEKFVDGAKKTSRELSRFSAKIAGTVDSVVSIDEYALHTLKRLRGDVDAEASLMAYIPSLNPFTALNAHTTEQKIQAALTQITTHMATKIPTLIVDAENLLSDLDNLEHALTLIGEVVHRERAVLHDTEQELLSTLWSRLWHSNLLSPQLRESFRHHKDILASVTSYRERALNLVSKTLVELVAIQTDLELFRERLVAPALGESVPLEVQIDSIKRSVDRLNRGRRRMEGRRNVGLVEGRREGEEKRGTRGDNDEEDF